MALAAADATAAGFHPTALPILACDARNGVECWILRCEWLAIDRTGRDRPGREDRVEDGVGICPVLLGNFNGPRRERRIRETAALIDDRNHRLRFVAN